MKANELEELQEEAQGLYHQGDYSNAVTVLERVIEVCVSSAAGGRGRSLFVVFISIAEHNFIFLRRIYYEVGGSGSHSASFLIFKLSPTTLFDLSQISPWDPESRELRADCFIRMGDPQKAIQDLTPTTRLRNDNRAAFLKLSMLHYSLGDHHESLK